jgi:hypothetical protein
MLLSVWSHYTLSHLAANMYVLWSFGPAVHDMHFKSSEHFMAFYVSAGKRVPGPCEMLFRRFIVVDDESGASGVHWQRHCFTGRGERVHARAHTHCSLAP